MRAGLIRLLFFAVLAAECFAQSNTPAPNLGSALSQGLADAMRESRAQEAAATNQQQNTGPLLSQVTITGKVIPAEWSAKEAATVSTIRGLSYKIVKDGEGATKYVTVTVTGAATRNDARIVARSIAKSPLVKTAWNGGDPNWGRILAAIGR